MALKLSPRERDLLELLLNSGEQTVADLRQAMGESISSSAIRTMLSRLMAKNAIRRKQGEHGIVYFAVIDSRSVGIDQLKAMARTFFEGSYLSAAAALLGASERLDRDALEEIERMIDAAKKQKEGG